MDSARAMASAGYFISPNELWSLIGSARAPQIVDTRKRAVYDSAPGLIPGATWRDIADIDRWSAGLDRDRPIVFCCRFAHYMSQIPVAQLRGEGTDARVLAGGYAAWIEVKLPLVNKATLDRLAPKRPSLWVTRRRPKIDRVACPWLIRKFVDEKAEFVFVPGEKVMAEAKRLDAIPYDVKDVELEIGRAHV